MSVKLAAVYFDAAPGMRHDISGEYGDEHWSGLRAVADAVEIDTLKSAVALLKSTPAVILAGKGGGYEILEERISLLANSGKEN